MGKDKANPVKPIKIGKKSIGGHSPVFIIAEAGVNHNGRLNLALKLIDKAAEAGADAVKFHTFRAERVATRRAAMADYQKKNLGREESQLAMLKKLELPEKYYPALQKRAREKKIIFIPTIHGGFTAVDFVKKIQAPILKFGSGDLTNLPVLQYAARLGRVMILGTGMANLAEVKEAISAIKKAGNKKIILLHCTSSYPCPSEEVNLRALALMRDELTAQLGYSDHTLGTQIAVMAVALGAAVIEKHLTLDRKMSGPDHKASAEPVEFKTMVRLIRQAEIILGSGRKEPTRSELKTALVARKSVVAARDIKIGERFSSENLEIKRPATGLQPKEYFKLLGKISRRNIARDELIKKSDYLL